MYLNVEEIRKIVTKKIGLFVNSDHYPFMDKIASKRFIINYLTEHIMLEFVQDNNKPINMIVGNVSMVLFDDIIYEGCNHYVNASELTYKLLELFKDVSFTK